MIKKTFILILLSVIFITAFSQWTAPVEIWPYTMAYFQPNAAHSLVADTMGNVHITWYDWSKDAYGCIKKTRYDGTDWLYTSSFLDDAAAGTGYYALSWMPTLSVEPDGKCLVVWEDYRTGSFELYSKYFNNSLWSSQITVTNTYDSYTWFPKLYYKAGRHHLVFMDDSTGFFNIYYTYFDSLFQQKVNITQMESNCISPDIFAYSDNDVSVIYTSEKDGYQTLYNVRKNGGVWEESFEAINLSANINSPNLISDSASEYVLFSANRSGTDNLYVSRFNSVSWDDEVLVSDTRSNSYYPAGIVSGGKLYIVYVSDENQYGNLYFIVYNPATKKVEEKTLIASHQKGYITLPQIAKDSRGDVHVVYIVNDETPVNEDQTNDIWWTKLPHVKNQMANSDKPYKTDFTYKECRLLFDDGSAYKVKVIDKLGRDLLSKENVTGTIVIKEDVLSRNDVYFILIESAGAKYSERILWVR
ncbi:MAG: hypothetical protein PHW02_03915 [bacterium]|nr:hypothetical protein [bacterium]